MVTLPDSAQNPLELAEDMGFVSDSVEVSAIRNFDDNIYLLTRAPSSAEFVVHAGTGSGPPWTQVGPAMIERICVPKPIVVMEDVTSIMQ